MSVNDKLEINVEDNNYPRPFVRYFAKGIDLFIYMSLIGLTFTILTVIFGVQVVTSGLIFSYMFHFIVFLLTLFLLIFFEAFLTHFFGNSLGRHYFNFRLASKDGSNLSFPQHLKRAFYLYIVGFGVLVFAFFTHIYWFFKLEKNNTTYWDDSAKTKVVHNKISLMKIIIGYIVSTVLVMVIGGMTMVVSMYIPDEVIAITETQTPGAGQVESVIIQYNNNNDPAPLTENN